MALTLYLIGLLPCLAATWEVWRICSARLRLSIAWLLTWLNASLLLYLSALIPGMVGRLSADWIAGTLAGLSIAAIAFWNWWGRRVPVGVDRAAMPEATPRPALNAGIFVAGLLGLFLMSPLLAFLGDLPFQLGPRAVMLEWDTVSYHLPELIQFLQQRTLWYQGGVFSSYSFGFELMAALPVACFHSSWPLVPIHLLGLTLAFSALYVIVEILMASVNQVVRRPLPAWIVFLLAAGLVARLFAFEMSRIGKNDLYQSGVLLAAIGLLFEYRRSWERGFPVPLRWLYLCGAGVAMGLALSTKPNALAYLPTFSLVAALAAPHGVFKSGTGLKQRLIAAAAPLALAVAIGGFFIARNLIMLGELVSPEHRWALQHSLLRVLLDRQNWGWYAGQWIVLLGLGSLFVPLVYAWRAWRRRSAWWTLAVLLGLQVTALIAFVNTPVSVPVPWVIDTRLGMIFFALGGAFLALALVQALSALAEVRRAPVLRLSGFVGLAVLLVGAPVYYQSFLDSLEPSPGLGMPGYELIWGQPTRIYRIIQHESRPLRIYSTGLRPLGLYGPGYQNTLFYDLHSSTEHYNHQTPAYLMAVLEQFKPDRIIMSVDPHPTSLSPYRPPLVEWMRQYPQYFTEMYSDAVVSMFRVNPGWEALKAQVSPEKKPIRMGF